MTKETQTVWTGANDKELLIQKGLDAFYIPLSYIDGKTLIELAGAVSDALKNVTPEEPCQKPDQ